MLQKQLECQLETKSSQLVKGLDVSQGGGFHIAARLAEKSLSKRSLKDLYRCVCCTWKHKDILILEIWQTWSLIIVNYMWSWMYIQLGIRLSGLLPTGSLSFNWLPASTRYPLLGGEVKRQLEIRSSGEETGSNAPIFAPVFSLAINVERSNMALAIA